ncbi:MAG: AbrB/MazE/SpoVT family DNA-binding domain-containing protein [Bryobacteraceae bacterium]|nr:AbrB/MazE/SpoVT family DNA-binding domain-containing protein [Bryobacteraceae bacterium]
MTTTIDAAGRVVIPKAIRDSLGLKAGAKVEIAERDGSIRIDTLPSDEVRIVRKGRLLVMQAPPGTPKMTMDDLNKLIEEIRNGPMDEFMGIK